jgi:hypothetical protein
MLNLDMKRDGDATSWREGAQAFPIADLDTYRRSDK